MDQTLEQVRRLAASPTLSELQQAVRALAAHAAENLIALNQLTGRRPDDAR